MWMVEGKQKDEWWHTAKLSAMIEAVASGKEVKVEKHQPFKTRRSAAKDYPEAPIKILKDVFCGRQRKGNSGG